MSKSKKIKNLENNTNRTLINCLDLNETLCYIENGTCERHLTCWYTNATSLNNKFSQFEAEINLYDPDIIMVCETWWKEHSIVNLSGYNLFRKDRIDRTGG